jgi:hypothetical protein
LTPDAEPTTLRIKPFLRTDLLDWVDSISGAGASIVGLAHAGNAGLGRFRDEVAYLAGECRKRGKGLSWVAVKRLYAEELGEYEAIPEGRPVRGTSHVQKRQVHMTIERATAEWIEEVTKDHELFDERAPERHALEFAIRLLRKRFVDGPARLAQFPFDGSPLWSRYEAALRA